MYEIPKVVEDLYFNMVTIPEPQNWPSGMRGSRSAIEQLYAFYAGLRLGVQISDACFSEELPLPQGDDGDFGAVE